MKNKKWVKRETLMRSFQVSSKNTKKELYMSQVELLEPIKTAIRDVLNNQKLVIEPASKLIGDLGLESIDFLDLSSEIENTIGFELDFKEVVQFMKAKNSGVTDIKSVTVENLIEFIETKQSSN